MKNSLTMSVNFGQRSYPEIAKWIACPGQGSN